jgi:hypothetical protein
LRFEATTAKNCLVASKEPQPREPADESDEAFLAKIRAYMDDAMTQYERAEIEDPELVKQAQAMLEHLNQPDPDDPRPEDGRAPPAQVDGA